MDLYLDRKNSMMDLQRSTRMSSKGQRVLRERKPEIRELSDGSDDEERKKNNRRSTEAYSRYIQYRSYRHIYMNNQGAAVIIP